MIEGSLEAKSGDLFKKMKFFQYTQQIISSGFIRLCNWNMIIIFQNEAQVTLYNTKICPITELIITIGIGAFRKNSAI